MTANRVQENIQKFQVNVQDSIQIKINKIDIVYIQIQIYL